MSHVEFAAVHKELLLLLSLSLIKICRESVRAKERDRSRCRRCFERNDLLWPWSSGIITVTVKSHPREKRYSRTHLNLCGSGSMLARKWHRRCLSRQSTTLHVRGVGYHVRLLAFCTLCLGLLKILPAFTGFMLAPPPLKYKRFCTNYKLLYSTDFSEMNRSYQSFGRIADPFLVEPGWPVPTKIYQTYSIKSLTDRSTEEEIQTTRFRWGPTGLLYQRAWPMLFLERPTDPFLVGLIGSRFVEVWLTHSNSGSNSKTPETPSRRYQNSVTTDATTWPRPGATWSLSWFS